MLEDIFEVLEIDPDGKKFDKVSRIRARSDLYEMDMLLDINVDIYPIELGDHLKIALSRSLTKGSAIPTPSTYEATVLSSANTLMNDYDYVMHGKVFKFKDSGETKAFNKAEVYISFGGLLMQLTGEIKQLEQLDLDQSIYLLMKKT